jgi:hypothetical protein
MSHSANGPSDSNNIFFFMETSSATFADYRQSAEMVP